MSGKEREMFEGLDAKTCSTCGRTESTQHLPGWPDGGKFMVVQRGKLCSNCARIVYDKLTMLNVGVETQTTTIVSPRPS